MKITADSFLVFYTVALAHRCLLIGMNGAGKSTLLRVLAGRHLTKPDGAVLVLDK